MGNAEEMVYNWWCSSLHMVQMSLSTNMDITDLIAIHQSRSGVTLPANYNKLLKGYSAEDSTAHSSHALTSHWVRTLVQNLPCTVPSTQAACWCHFVYWEFYETNNCTNTLLHAPPEICRLPNLHHYIVWILPGTSQNTFSLSRKYNTYSLIRNEYL